MKKKPMTRERLEEIKNGTVRDGSGKHLRDEAVFAELLAHAEATIEKGAA